MSLASYGRFRPSKCDDHSGYGYYRGCWHPFTQPLFSMLFYRMAKVAFLKRNATRGVTLSRLRALQRIRDCCTPKRWRPCLSAPLGDIAPTTPTRLRLGGPLPRQLPDGAQTNPVVNITATVMIFCS